MEEPLDVLEDGGVSYIHVCVCQGRHHAQCASDAVMRLDSTETSKYVGALYGQGCTNCAF